MEAPLSSRDEQRCLEFLTQHFTDEAVGIGRVRQNDLADWLLRQPVHSEATALALLDVIADTDADLLWREFCVQKLDRAMAQPDVTQATRNRCLEALRQKTREPEISFAGTALLGLYRLSLSEGDLITPAELVTKAEYILQSPRFATANKVSALQIAGLSGSQYALELARSLIPEQRQPLQLRISATALLGHKGDPADLQLLQPLRNSPDARLRNAANAAVNRLKN